MTEWHPPEPHEDRLTKRPIDRLRELATGPAARVVWRHATCRRIVAVVVDTPDRWLETYSGIARMMCSRDSEGVTIAGRGEAVHVTETIPPPPVVVRCCGAPWQVSWSDLWDDAIRALGAGRPTERTLPH